MWWKAKTQRWRGAVYEEPGGQAWLCAAGYRYEGEVSDFYRQFTAHVLADGPEGYLPTDEDRRLLDRENAEREFVEWESGLQDVIQRLCFEAQGAGMVTQTLPGPDGLPLAEVSIAYSAVEVDDAEESLVDVYFEFSCLNWAAPELLEWAENVMLLAIDPNEQVWQPTHIRDGRAYSLVLTEDEATPLFQAMESGSRRPGEGVMGEHAHWTHRERLTESTVNGEAVKGLCGVWFVPRQDHEGRPRCPRCDMVHRGLQD